MTAEKAGGPKMMKVEVLRDCWDSSKRLRPGTTVEVTAEDAKALHDKGLIRLPFPSDA